tara:strand:- start:270 stop:431 length:162 start_codon:yes stop_codon:yes gene_type:complete
MLFFIEECTTARLAELYDHPAATPEYKDMINSEIIKRIQDDKESNEYAQLMEM